jgi:hypothetical protein
MVLQLTKPNLDNLFKNGHLKQEPCDQEEIGRMLEISHRRLLDSQIPEMSIEGRFTSAYNAAHGDAVAALRLAWLQKRESFHGLPVPWRYARVACKQMESI